MGLKQNLHKLKEKYRGKKMAPAFNALHTFLYTPNEVTHGGTHIKAADDLKRTMNIVIMALVPCLIFGIFNAGYQHYAAIDMAQGLSVEASWFGNFFTWENFWFGAIRVLPLVIVSSGVGLLVEFFFNYHFHRSHSSIRDHHRCEKIFEKHSFNQYRTTFNIG